MTETTASVEPKPAASNLFARLVGVVVAPKATFEGIVAQPRWFGAVLVTAVLVAGIQFAFLSTEVGQQATIDQQIRQMESFGMTVTAEAQQGIEAGIGRARYFASTAILVMSFVMTALFAGIGYAVFTAMMGGSATYKQLLAVIAHAGAISVLGQLFTVPLNYARETVSSATNLSVFLPFLDEGSLLSRFAGMIDIFVIWWLVVLAIGFAVLYRRRTGPIFASFAGVYVVIAAVIAVIMRVAAGSQ